MRGSVARRFLEASARSRSNSISSICLSRRPGVCLAAISREAASLSSCSTVLPKSPRLFIIANQLITDQKASFIGLSCISSLPCVEVRSFSGLPFFRALSKAICANITGKRPSAAISRKCVAVCHSARSCFDLGSASTYRPASNRVRSSRPSSNEAVHRNVATNLSLTIHCLRRSISAARGLSFF